MTQTNKPLPKSKALSSKPAPDPFKRGVSYSTEELDAILATMTGAQRAKVDAIITRSRERADGPLMAVAIENSNVSVTYSHTNREAASLLLMADMGTCDPSFLEGVTGQVAIIGVHGRPVDSTASNFLMSVVRAVQPRDELETLLAVQMGAIHSATMMMARRLNHVETIPQQDAAERALNKLARTYAMQMEALKRYRTGGQQKVIVEHVTVNAGGQAIVGAVTK